MSRLDTFSWGGQECTGEHLHKVEAGWLKLSAGSDGESGEWQEGHGSLGSGWLLRGGGNEAVT